MTLHQFNPFAQVTTTALKKKSKNRFRFFCFFCFCCFCFCFFASLLVTARELAGAKKPWVRAHAMLQQLLLDTAIDLMERGLVPDALIRWGIRLQCRERLAGEAARVASLNPKQPPRSPEALLQTVRAFSQKLARGPVAPVPEKANEQHYEVPAAFFNLVLGARRKYSCCFYPEGVKTLDAAEEAALQVTCERAGLEDGQDVLELGCGWGSLSLWMAERFVVVASSRAALCVCVCVCARVRVCVFFDCPISVCFFLYCPRSFTRRSVGVVLDRVDALILAIVCLRRYPRSRIMAVSNSSSQREFIEGVARERGLTNLTIITADMNDFSPPAGSPRFHRVVSLEMFEHMSNYRELLRRVSSWLLPEGRLFVHTFCHKDYAYNFQVEGASNWMGKYFFTGGVMPSEHLLENFAENMEVTPFPTLCLCMAIGTVGLLDFERRPPPARPPSAIRHALSPRRCFALIRVSALLVQVERRWAWNGTHYGKTSNHWLANMDKHRVEVREILTRTYGEKDVGRWVQRWRVFFMACAELFDYNKGNEWYVTHSLLRPVMAGGGAAAPVAAQ